MKIPDIKKLNIEKPYLVEVQWIDAIGNAQWFDPAEILDWLNYNRKCAILDTGWLLHKDKDCVLMAMRKHKRPDDIVFQWGGLHFIPIAWIKVIRRLK